MQVRVLHGPSGRRVLHRTETLLVRIEYGPNPTFRSLRSQKSHHAVLLYPIDTGYQCFDTSTVRGGSSVRPTKLLAGKSLDGRDNLFPGSWSSSLFRNDHEKEIRPTRAEVVRSKRHDDAPARRNGRK